MQGAFSYCENIDKSIKDKYNNIKTSWEVVKLFLIHMHKSFNLFKARLF